MDIKNPIQIPVSDFMFMSKKVKFKSKYYWHSIGKYLVFKFSPKHSQLTTPSL